MSRQLPWVRLPLEWCFDGFTDLLDLPPGHGGRIIAGEVRVAVRKLRRIEGLISSYKAVVKVVAEQEVPSWKDGWKELTFEGYDVYKGTREIDYGNNVYRSMTMLMMWLDGTDELYQEMHKLSIRWPAMSPFAQDSHGTLDKQGDIFELFLAALRGNQFSQTRCFGPHDNLPALFSDAVGACQAAHNLDAYLHSKINWNNEVVSCLQTYVDGLEQHPVVRGLKYGDSRTRATVYLGLVRSTI